VAAARPERGRLVSLQILRGIAASLVVINHTFTTLDFVGMAQPRFGPSANLIGGLGVAAFFVLSGFLMVRQTREQFGSFAAAWTFAYRRVVRVVPLYWVATVALYLAERHWGWLPAHAKTQLALSLSFLPNYLSAFAMQPIVAQGWTLNYEMAFYALFTVCLLLPRRWGLTALMAVLLTAFGIGCVHYFPQVPSPAAWLNFLTGRVLILFAAGAAIGILEQRLQRLPSLRLPVLPILLLLLVPAGVLLAFPWMAQDSITETLLWCCAVAAVLLCTLVEQGATNWLRRGLSLLGDASYSTYLFHLWVMSRTILRLAKYPALQAFSPWVYVAGCLVVANMLGLIVHFVLERPMTNGLRKIRFGHRGRTEPDASNAEGPAAELGGKA
jgi:peptidoglycan/LPS O-acetylase OafA/YrhL